MFESSSRFLDEVNSHKQLRNEIRRGEHVGAGLHVTICVGNPESEFANFITFNLTDSTADVLEALRLSHAKTLKLSKLLLDSNLRDAQNYNVRANAAFQELDIS